MRLLLFSLLGLNTFYAQSQVKGELSIGVLQSIGKSRWELISSSSQGVGVAAPVHLRFAKQGIRARASLLHPLNKMISLQFTTGLNLRRGERVWTQKSFTYVSLPMQAGLGCRLLGRKHTVLSVKAYSGINIFHLRDDLSRRQTGLLHNAEVSYAIPRKGFFTSYQFKAGWEMEVDNETFFFKSTEPNFKDENFHYKVKRNQLYIALGIGI